MTSKQTITMLQTIDDVNKQDPNTEYVDGIAVAKELIYGKRMSECLDAYWPNACEQLKIAVRAQHIKRWHLKRTEFDEGRTGYLKWRKALGQFHANFTAELMLTHGFTNEEAEQTSAIISKENLKSNPQSQTLEDVACLVFLKHYFLPFAAKHSEEKIIRILQKTWRKMSPHAHEIALTITLPDHLAELVNKALNPV